MKIAIIDKNVVKSVTSVKDQTELDALQSQTKLKIVAIPEDQIVLPLYSYKAGVFAETEESKALEAKKQAATKEPTP